ncbi:recombinase RecT [Thiorhodovibrio frisius]|uniref:RecT family n=1 Tax=Thiorhodovibrio frisius TaxID=631362 RepID=H8YW22_9GAMM|nr:recombinase RecT [Thiorhodovibrio frisius]EIC23813.1 RecT family [Thiorhodovibrio frisius]
MTRSMQAVPKADAPRIPMPAVDPALNVTPSTWKVLTDSIFPAAKTAEGILLAVHYCAARNLDVIKRPVHVVPMWSKALGQEIETVWPGIAEVQTTAARTGQWAGIDPPRFGPVIERTFSGRIKRNGAWQELDYSVSFPEWCEVTVYRLVGGQRCPFTEPVFWLEAYARQGGAYSELPTEMWVKRPRGQLMKCAKAASLRAAFPEEASYTAEEMEGKVIEADTSIPVRRWMRQGLSPRRRILRHPGSLRQRRMQRHRKHLKHQRTQSHVPNRSPSIPACKRGSIRWSPARRRNPPGSRPSSICARAARGLNSNKRLRPSIKPNRPPSSAWPPELS